MCRATRGPKPNGDRKKWRKKNIISPYAHNVHESRVNWNRPRAAGWWSLSAAWLARTTRLRRDEPRRRPERQRLSFAGGQQHRGGAPLGVGVGWCPLRHHMNPWTYLLRGAAARCCCCCGSWLLVRARPTSFWEKATREPNQPSSAPTGSGCLVRVKCRPTWTMGHD
jgi:hypothetical protein